MLGQGSAPDGLLSTKSREDGILCSPTPLGCCCCDKAGRVGSRRREGGLRFERGALRAIDEPTRVLRSLAQEPVLEPLGGWVLTRPVLHSQGLFSPGTGVRAGNARVAVNQARGTASCFGVWRSQRSRGVSLPSLGVLQCRESANVKL
jgi:hypothetical protein